MTRQANQSKAWDFYLGREVSEVSDASLPFYRKGNWSYEFKHTQRSRSSAGSKHGAPGFHLVDFSISQDLSRKDNRISFKCHAQLHLVFINKTYVVCWFCDEGTHARCGGHLAGMESSWFSLRGHALQPVKYDCHLAAVAFSAKQRTPSTGSLHVLWVPEEAHQDACACHVLFQRGWTQELVGFDFYLKKKSPPSPPPTLYTTAHPQTNNPSQKIAKALIPHSNVLRLLLGESFPRLCTRQQNCNLYHTFSSSLCFCNISWVKVYPQATSSFLKERTRIYWVPSMY